MSFFITPAYAEGSAAGAMDPGMFNLCSCLVLVLSSTSSCGAHRLNARKSTRI